MKRSPHLLMNLSIRYKTTNESYAIIEPSLFHLTNFIQLKLFFQDFEHAKPSMTVLFTHIEKLDDKKA